jgi:hypothetical protein
MNAQYQPVRLNSNGWISIPIRPWSLSGFSLMAGVMLVGIIILTAFSQQRSGFVTIESDAFSALGSRWKLSLLWTSLPNFIFNLAAIYWDAIVAAFVDRQPYVELSKSPTTEGVSLKKSILLDYRTEFTLWRWVAALKNRHILIGLSILLGLVYSIIAVPLSAGLMVPRIHIQESEMSILEVTGYNEVGLNSTTDWKPVFDKVATVTLYNGERYPWTNDEFAFPTFVLPGGRSHSSLPRNVTTTANGTSAYLDCKAISDYRSSVVSTVDILTRVSIQGNDRGCDFLQEFGIANTTSIYLETTTVRSCSLDAYQSRLVFTAGEYSDTTSFPLSNVTVISCIAGYATAKGRLTFSSVSNTTGLSFEKTGERYIQRHQYADVIESNMFLSTEFSLNSAWSTSHFGSIVLYLAKEKEPSAYLASDILIENIRTVFTASYLTAAAMNSFRPKANPAFVSAAVSQTQTRLFIVEWIAALSIAILGLCLTFNVFIWRSVQGNHSILVEEPQGLLSAAGLLHGSNIFDALVGNYCTPEAYDRQFVKSVERRYDVNRSLCVIDRNHEHAHAVIDVLRVEPARAY